MNGHHNCFAWKVICRDRTLRVIMLANVQRKRHSLSMECCYAPTPARTACVSPLLRAGALPTAEKCRRRN